jgi:hypothetical protein
MRYVYHDPNCHLRSHTSTQLETLTVRPRSTLHTRQVTRRTVVVSPLNLEVLQAQLGVPRVRSARRATHGHAMAAAAMMLAGAVAAAAAEGPCDILGAAGNPCVAAHSTVRALYANYSGPLYNVTRASDGTSALVSVLEAGGYANIATHEAFCSKLDCVISNVFDQSPQRNHLGQRHKLVNASRHKIIAGGKSVYGMWFDPGYGMHVDNTTGVATGNDPESIYAVMSGTHYNGGCCFVSWPAPPSRAPPTLSISRTTTPAHSTPTTN